MKFILKKVKYRHVPYVIFLLLIFFLLSILVIYKLQKTNYKYANLPAKKVTEADAGKVKLPLDLNNRNINAFYLYYGFAGYVKEVKKVEDGVQIVLVTEESGLPNIVVKEPESIINLIKKGKATGVVGINALRAGQNVDISAFFNHKTNEWIIKNVNILE